jgi:uncharacterized protein (DUF779 family)
MTTVRITPRAAAVVSRVRSERTGPLTFTIDGGCCEGTAPHLFEHAVLTSAAEKVGEVEGVPVYLQPAMVPLYADAEVTIDVIDEPVSDALSLETEYGLRFVLRESPGGPPRRGVIEEGSR